MDDFINDRKLVTFGICLALGIFVGNLFFQSTILYAYAAIITITALVLFLFKRLELKVLLYCVALCIGIFSISISKWIIISDQDDFYVGTSECTLYVLDVTKDDSINVIADNVTINGKTYNGKVSVYIYGTEPFDIEPGQTIKLTAKFSKPRTVRNPYGSDYNFYLQQNGIAMSVSANASTCELVSESSLGIRGVFISAKDAIESKIDELYGENAAIIKGMLLGNKTEISEDVIENFRISGIAHIFAISGLHIGFLVAFLLYLLRLIKLKDKNIFFIIALILACYCAVTNFSASIVRASIMAVIVLGAKILGKRQDTLISLFAAGIIILLFDPFALFKVGFQLSFCAVLGILLLSNPCLKALKKLPRYLKKVISATIGAQCGIVLVSAYYFYNVSVYSIIVNMLVLPAIGALVILAFISVFVGIISSIIAVPFIYVVNILLYVLSLLTSFVSSLPYASVIIGKPPVYIIACAFLIMYIISKYVMISNYKKLVASLLVLITLFGITIFKQYTSFKGLQITVFDVGQGDSAYIQTPGGYRILIDGGPLTDSYDAGESVLLPYFYATATQDIDIVIATHCHSDHVGGLISVAEGLNIKYYLEPNDAQYSDDDTAYLQLKSVLSSEGVACNTVKTGNVIELDDGVKIEILYPGDNEDLDENERAIVAKITYNDFSMVFTADIDSDIEREIYGSLGSVNVLKVAHHGSKYSTNEDFLSETTPQIAIISVGANNYGHPATETIDRLTQAGANIYRTDTNGAVIIKVYNDKYTVESMIN